MISALTLSIFKQNDFNSVGIPGNTLLFIRNLGQELCMEVSSKNTQL